jgi:hypothetical protein
MLERATAAGLGLAVLALAAVARAADGPPAFFDPLLTSAPGISREVGLLVDHARQSDGHLTQPSLRLQYPVLPFLQFSLEAPVVFRDDGTSASGAGDLLAVGQARVFVPADGSAEVDAGLEVTLPTGNRHTLGGATTALRPFVAAGIRLGPIDLLGSVSYQWIVDGPSGHGEVAQAAVAVGRPFGRITPFVEFGLLIPVSGAEDHRPQPTVVPGVELYATPRLSLSLGVQLPLSSARSADLRVLGFLRWAF